MTPHYRDATVTLHHGDCLDVLRELPDASVDSVVTDPPYGLEFMGREWDGADGFRRSLNPADVDRDNPFGRTSRTSPEYRAGALFQEWCEAWATECLRVLKPGGVMVSFGGTRTFHRLACAIEDAGFEIRDSLAWIHGQGFPKSRNVTADLRSLPACTCDVSGELGSVDAALPSGLVGTGVRAEPGTVPLARGAADSADRVGPEVCTASALGSPDVDTLDVDLVGKPLPVVLGSPGVAGAAEGEQVVCAVGGVEVDPEALRDEVMGQQSVEGATVRAGAVSSEDGCSDVRPAAPLVLPLAAAPGGVCGPVESVSVADGHASSGAVDGGVGPSAELVATDGADVDAVSGALHADHSTAERPVRCEACSGVRGAIPDGLGTALKPAHEPIVVARKPLTGTVAANVLAHGTGALNIDGCRVGYTSDADKASARPGGKATSLNGALAGKEQLCATPNTAAPMRESFTTSRTGNAPNATSPSIPRTEFEVAQGAGRWPANVVLDESQANALNQQSGETVSNVRPPNESGADQDGWGLGSRRPQERGHDDQGGASRFFYIAREDTPCSDDSSDSPPSTDTTGSTGREGSVAQAGASPSAAPVERLTSTRFRYEPKADASERVRINGTAHPTVKPLALMRWLVRLVTPPGGTILEPFAGSGTTVEAAILEGFHCIAIEREADYLPLIVQRIHRRRDPVAAVRSSGEDGGLFDLLDEEPA